MLMNKNIIHGGGWLRMIGGVCGSIMLLSIIFPLFVAHAESTAPANDSPSNTPSSQTYTIGLGGSCYPVQTVATRGDRIAWRGNVYGGNGDYTYSWTGTEGLSGDDVDASIAYDHTGIKVGTLHVSSGGHTLSIPCSSNVTVYDASNSYSGNTYNNNRNNPYIMQLPGYGVYGNGSQSIYDTSVDFGPLTLFCAPTVRFANVGTRVRWQAQASGGNGYYTFRWNGTDNLAANGDAPEVTYTMPGLKYASVAVISGGYTASLPCAMPVLIGKKGEAAPAQIMWPTPGAATNNNEGVVPQQPVYYAQPSTAGSPVYAPVQPYSYYENLNDTPSPAPVVKSSAPRMASTASSSSLAEAALTVFTNIPWSWVVVVILFVIGGTVMYLLMNQKSI